MQVDFQNYHDQLQQDLEQIYGTEVQLSYNVTKTNNVNKVMMNEWILKIKGERIFENKMFTYLLILSNKEPDVFPKKAPRVFILETSKGYRFTHPNIYNYDEKAGRAEICLAILDKWNPDSIIELIQALKDFILNPNLIDLANFEWAKKKDQFELSMINQIEKLDDWE